MEFESYADIIDAFERDDMGYETVTDYINGENIKIKEIEMVEKANGGLTTMGYENGGGIGSMMQPKKKKNKTKEPVVQGGVDNYLGKQPQVQAPRTWQSSPDKPATELAYITKAEKDLIIKENIHGGLEGGPNMGPSGIMSLDSFGDAGGGGASGGDTDTGGGASDQGGGPGSGGFSGRNTNTTSARDFERQKANQRAVLQMAERKQADDLRYNERQNITGIDRSNPNYNRSGIFGGKFNPLSLIAGLVGGPLAGLFAKGIGGLKGGFKGLTGRMRGINPLTGEPNTQAEYEQALNNRRTESRRDKMQSRIDKGYNSIFGMRTGDITDQQRATLANLNTQTGVSNNLIGGDPTSSRFEGFSPRVGNTNNSMPKANVIMPGGPQYNLDNFGTAKVPSGPGYAGNSNEGFVNDPYGTPDQGFVNDPYGTSDQGFVNDPYGTPDQGFVNDPYGTPDQGFVNDPYGTPDQGFQGIGETIASITNNQLPGNNLMADISQQDIDTVGNFRFSPNQKASGARDIIEMSGQNLNSTITDAELESIINGSATAPTGKFAVARNGGIMGYGRG